MYCGHLVIVLTALLFIETNDASSCTSNRITDGCSIPFNLPFFYKREFRNACNQHDTCYHCGSMYGTSRNRCDIQFHSNMQSYCSRAPFWQREICREIARHYYTAVDTYGASSFKIPSPGWCRQSWTRPCSDF